MIDFVFPDNNEKDFIRIAERLGLKGLCFVYDTPTRPPVLKTRLKIYSAVLCSEKMISRYRNKYLTLMHCSSQDSIRVILEQHRPDIFFSLEFPKGKDFIHHRASGINQVHAALAKKNNTHIGFSFSDILKNKGSKRASIMGRMAQNISFARKYSFPICIATFTDNPYHLRASQDISSFFQTLGMHPSEIKSAHNSVYKLLETHIN